ncbi:hypothetical protein Tsubulata_009396 [Turnera subulata]|uniref:Pentacotripeptide-repeat region of PRORP domain-containing protein n=1 Tax=Turnera subulata TaxID=218843 RepID=A0A9Q0JH97_9ROSI|nr:hypothetical protein Tsubulata_009396 [Turnera subulata]
MIRGYGRSQSPQKSIELFNQMVATEAEPDGFTYSYLFSGCAKAGMLREGEQVHGRVLVSGYSSDVFVETNLVNFYAANGGVRYARQVFDDMGERNVVSWNSMLAAYMRCGNVDGARRIFDDMPERNVVSWTSMISGYARNGKCRQALFLFNEMRRAHVEPDRAALVPERRHSFSGTHRIRAQVVVRNNP